MATVPPGQGGIQILVKIIPQERVQQRTVEQMADISAPQVAEEFVEVLQTIHQERISERIAVQIVNVPVEVPKWISGTSATTDLRARYVSQECISERICEHMVDVPVPQVVGQLFDAPKTSSRYRILHCIVEQISRCSCGADDTAVGGCAEIVFHDRIQQRTLVQIADILVPQVVDGGTRGGFHSFSELPVFASTSVTFPRFVFSAR